SAGQLLKVVPRLFARRRLPHLLDTRDQEFCQVQAPQAQEHAERENDAETRPAWDTDRLPVGRLIPFMFAPLLCDSNHLTGSPRIKSQDQFAALIGRETVGREVAVFFPPPPGFLFSNWRHHENDLLWAAEAEDL